MPAAGSSSEHHGAYGRCSASPIGLAPADVRPEVCDDSRLRRNDLNSPAYL